MRDNVISSFIKRQLGISKLELWGEQAKEKLLWEKYFRKKINQQPATRKLDWKYISVPILPKKCCRNFLDLLLFSCCGLWITIQIVHYKKRAMQDEIDSLYFLVGLCHCFLLFFCNLDKTISDLRACLDEFIGSTCLPVAATCPRASASK